MGFAALNCFMEKIAAVSAPERPVWGKGLSQFPSYNKLCQMFLSLNVYVQKSDTYHGSVLKVRGHSCEATVKKDACVRPD